MTNELTRRDWIRTGSLGLGALALPEWAFPALAQGEELVPFTDYPEGWKVDRGPESRFYDIRNIDGPVTPAGEFFTVQHHGHPKVDGASYRLKVTGMVKKPLELSLDDLKAYGETELVAGFECSGNSPRAMQGLVSNGRWTGVPLQKVLNDAGVHDEAREVVFFGADSGTEEVEFRGRKYDVEQQYGRSISVENASSPDPFLATGLNAAPLTVHQGSPVRVIMPGWYGAPNVKWLANIHVQHDAYMGKYQARWYRTLRAREIGGEMKWVETAITHMRLKSVIARVTRQGGRYKVMGFALTGGVPLKSVEVKIDDGPWKAAKLLPSEHKWAWKLFTYDWEGATPGKHTLVSRATNENGTVQPTLEELENKKTFLEDNSQHPRTVII